MSTNVAPVPCTENAVEVISLALDAAANFITDLLNEGAAPGDPRLLAASEIATAMVASMTRFGSTPADELLATWCL